MRRQPERYRGRFSSAIDAIEKDLGRVEADIISRLHDCCDGWREQIRHSEFVEGRECDIFGRAKAAIAKGAEHAQRRGPVRAEEGVGSPGVGEPLTAHRCNFRGAEIPRPDQLFVHMDALFFQRLSIALHPSPLILER